jgi:hypothetical protein
MAMGLHILHNCVISISETALRCEGKNDAQLWPKKFGALPGFLPPALRQWVVEFCQGTAMIKQHARHMMWHPRLAVTFW